MTMRFHPIWIFLAACGGNAASPDAPSLDSAGPDAWGVCGSVVDIGNFVEETQVATSVPTATGGTIADGRYTLTHWFWYTGPGGPTGGTGLRQSQTVELGGSLAHGASTNSNAGTMLQTYMLSTTGTSVSVTQTCPEPAQQQPWDHFSQVGNVLTFYSSSKNLGLEYTRMP